GPGDRDILGHRTEVYAENHRHVVGAVERHGEELACGAVAGNSGEGIGDRLPGAELLDGGLAVVGGVGPVAGGSEREGAEAVRSRREIGRASGREAVESLGGGERVVEGSESRRVDRLTRGPRAGGP